MTRALVNRSLPQRLPAAGTTKTRSVAGWAECAEALFWYSARKVFECPRCRYDLWRSKARFVPRDIFERTREFFALFSRQACSPLPPPFANMPDRVVFEAMAWLAYFTDIPIGAWLNSSGANGVDGYFLLRQ
jgi:hypothetical protein